jgi:glycosyltransferase involved in cell wall biosynthesis
MEQNIINSSCADAKTIIIEPFYGGSHKQMIQLLTTIWFDGTQYALFTTPAKKWKWRLRAGSLHFASIIPQSANFKTLFCSSMLNLAELVAVRPDLVRLRKVLYFHENQMNYPVRHEQERDIQFAWNQILSCMAADVVLFNSQYNMTSFLHSMDSLFKMMPKDQCPIINNLRSLIGSKSHVLYFPIDFSIIRDSLQRTNVASELKSGPMHVLWNHRWEWDKRPDVFFEALMSLVQDKVPFVVSVLGEQFGEVPEEFAKYKELLTDHIKHWGYAESRDEYFRVLGSADVVVSTTDHEFFGVSIIEAIYSGCYPFCPNRLVFPEYLHEEHLYNTVPQLVKKLRYYGKNIEKSRQKTVWKSQIDLERFDWTFLKPEFEKYLNCK